MTSAVARRAQELAGQGTAFVTATVVRAQRPTSARPGDVALVLPDGTIEGFVGGMCAQQTVRVYSLQALETGEALLLRILPDASEADPDDQGREIASEEGSVTVQNTCLSGGAIEVFLDPSLPAPRVLVAGDTPAATAIRSLGAQLGLELVAVDAQGPEPAAGDLALVVATHGRDELHALRRALEADVPYVGLVASIKRGAGVLDELRADGVGEADLAKIDVPAGIDIGGRTPAEIALSVLAAIVAVRRGRPGAVPALGHLPAPVSAPRADAPRIAVDPICGMTVAVVADTPRVELDGETTYFCCEGCATKFRAEHDLTAAAE
jgi:xanthine dehydrogenase accessory factor